MFGPRFRKPGALWSAIQDRGSCEDRVDKGRFPAADGVTAVWLDRRKEGAPVGEWRDGGPRPSLPDLSQEVAAATRPTGARCGNSVVTGGKIGLRASRGKGFAKKIVGARAMTRRRSNRSLRSDRCPNLTGIGVHFHRNAQPSRGTTSGIRAAQRRRGPRGARRAHGATAARGVRGRPSCARRGWSTPRGRGRSRPRSRRALPPSAPRTAP